MYIFHTRDWIFEEGKHIERDREREFRFILQSFYRGVVYWNWICTPYVFRTATFDIAAIPSPECCNSISRFSAFTRASCADKRDPSESLQMRVERCRRCMSMQSLKNSSIQHSRKCRQRTDCTEQTRTEETKYIESLWFVAYEKDIILRNTIINHCQQMLCARNKNVYSINLCRVCELSVCVCEFR